MTKEEQDKAVDDIDSFDHYLEMMEGFEMEDRQKEYDNHEEFDEGMIKEEMSAMATLDKAEQ